jgi:hypothetical protein
MWTTCDSLLCSKYENEPDDLIASLDDGCSVLKCYGNIENERH